MARKPFYESDSEARWWAAGFGRVLLYVILVGVLCAIVAGGVGAWNYFTASTKGKIEQTQQINTGQNRTAAQEHFETLYGDIKTQTANIQVAQQALESASPDDKSRRQTELIGLQQTCNAAVNTYNADARKVSKEEFRTADLPEQIDPFDESTDCKVHAMSTSSSEAN